MKIKGLSENKILLIGAAILDILVTPAGPEVFETGSYPAEQIQMSFGGDALNEAIILASLGKKVYLNTILGEDLQGDLIRSYCEKQGIKLVRGCQKENISTGINVVLVEANGERNFLTNRKGSLRKLSKEDVQMPFLENVGILCLASIFVSPMLGAAEMTEIFQQAKKQGICVCADMTKCKNGETAEDMAEALQYVDYLIPNEEEAYLLTKNNTPEAAAKRLQEAGAKNIIIKCGKKGCYILESYAEEGYYVSAMEGVTCVDTTGAGDSFSAGFIYGLSEGWNIRKCAEFANQCGAKAVQQIGATTWCEEMKK